MSRNIPKDCNLATTDDGLQEHSTRLYGMLMQNTSWDLRTLTTKVEKYGISRTGLPQWSFALMPYRIGLAPVGQNHVWEIMF